MNHLEIFDYNGRRVTAAEKMLLELHDERISLFRKEREEKEAERNLLLKSVSLINELATAGTKRQAKTPSVIDHSSSEQVIQSLNILPPSINDKYEEISPSKRSPQLRPSSPKINVEVTNEVTDTTNEDYKLIDNTTTSEVTKKIKRKRDDYDDDEVYQPVDYSAVGALEQLGHTVLFSGNWHAASQTEPLIRQLHNFGFHGKGYNSVLTVKMKIPSDTNRWAMNICPKQHLNNQNIYLHFNPRYKKKNELVLNDKPGTWGHADKSRHFLPTQLMMLVIVIQPEAFYIFSEPKRLITSFIHRRDISKESSLTLIFPHIDDNGNPENVIIEKIWWGEYNFKIDFVVPPESASENERKYLKYQEANPYMSYIPRTLVVQGLPRINDGQEIMDLEAALFDVFKDENVESVNLVMGQAIGYVRFKTIDDMNTALKTKNNFYLASEDESNTFSLRLSKMEELLK